MAAALRDWLPLVIQSVHPWYSPDDIDKGARWLNELSVQLDKQRVGIICITSENQSAAWLLFEAGALSKALDSSRVCPLLLDIEPTDLKGPLSQFQSTRTNKSDIRALLTTLNRQLETPVAEAHLDTLHEALWPKLEAMLKAAAEATSTPKPATRQTPDLLTEVLSRVRSIERQLNDRRPRNGTLTEEAGYQKALQDRREEVEEKLEELYAERMGLTIELARLPSGSERNSLERLMRYVDDMYLELKAELGMPSSTPASPRRKRKKKAPSSDG